MCSHVKEMRSFFILTLFVSLLNIICVNRLQSFPIFKKKSIQIFIFRLHSSSNNAVDGENTAQVNRIMLRRATISSERGIDLSFNEESVHQTNQTFDGLDLSTSRHSTPIERKTAYTLKRSRSVATIAKNVSFDLGRNREFHYNYNYPSQDESSTDESVSQYNNLSEQSETTGTERNNGAHASTVGSTSNSGVDKWLNES